MGPIASALGLRAVHNPPDFEFSVAGEEQWKLLTTDPPSCDQDDNQVERTLCRATSVHPQFSKCQQLSKQLQPEASHHEISSRHIVDGCRHDSHRLVIRLTIH